MKKIWLSILFAALTGAIGILQIKMLEGKIQKGDALANFLENIESFLASYHVSSFGVINFIDLGAERLDTSLLINYIITYTPVYFLVFLVIQMLLYLFNIVFK